MITVSDAYKNLMDSTVRPKCEPIITVSSIPGTETETYEWNASQIQSMEFHRSIDPVGRELPVMELTWTELYYGKIGTSQLPDKYKNVSVMQMVQLSFVQNTQFYETWKGIKDRGETWASLLGDTSEPNTWADVKNNKEPEKIEMPWMFISELPVVSGNTIKWTAKDPLYFLNEYVIKGFGMRLPNEGRTTIPYENPGKWLLVNSLTPYLDMSAVSSGREQYRNMEMIRIISNAIQSIPDMSYEILSGVTVGDIYDNIILQGQTNALLKDLLATKSYYLNFHLDPLYGFKLTYNSLGDFTKSQTAQAAISADMMYSEPKLAKCSGVSAYAYNKYSFEAQNEESSSTNITQVHTLVGKSPSGSDVEYDYYLNKWSIPQLALVETFDDAHSKSRQNVFQDLVSATETQLYCTSGNPPYGGGSPGTIYIHPIESKATKKYIDVTNTAGVNSVKNGMEYFEDISFNPGSDGSAINSRANTITAYFAQTKSTIQAECVPNLAIETGDIVAIDTVWYNENGTRVRKNYAIVDMTITYSGGLREKIIGHEVS